MNIHLSSPVKFDSIGNFISLEMVGLVKAGYPVTDMQDSSEGVSLEHFLVSDYGHSYLLRVQENKLAAKGIYLGDLVVLDSRRKPVGKDLVAVYQNDRWVVDYYESMTTNDQIAGVVTSVIRKMY